MNTIHRWFPSAAYSLLGHFDLPETPRENTGVLIVPPFGWEDVCSYRPLRFLARTLAACGIPVLRFDLPGTGDSSGDALDPGLFEAWIQSVNDAAAELRTAAGVEAVAAVGIRLGALLAASAASRGSHLQDLVLWGPAANGRSMLRELRAFGNMERLDYPNGDTSAAPPISGLEIGGFLIAPETQGTIENLELSKLPGMQGRRVLVLSRDRLPADAKSIRALETAGCRVEVGTGSGYAAMMALPHEAIPPATTARVIAEFLTRDLQQKRQSNATGTTENGFKKPSPVKVTKAVIGGASPEISEAICTVKYPSGSMLGILCSPEPMIQRPELCVLFLNSGSVRHTGPNRMWVEATRRWATRGIASLRLDLAGIGESDGEPSLGTEGLYQDRMLDQIDMAIDSMRSRLGFSRFMAIGLCSGAFWAFHSAIRRPDVCAAVLLNPRLFFWDPEVDRRRLLRRTAKGLTTWADWWRLARGDVPLESIEQLARIGIDRIQVMNAGQRTQIPSEAMAQAWATIERNESRVTLIFTQGEPLLREMEEEGQLPPTNNPRVRCVRVADCGHTFRPLWAQKLAHELIDGELDAVLRESREHSLHADGKKRRAAGETTLQ